MKQSISFWFLPAWGTLVALVALFELINPSSSFGSLESPFLMAAMLLVGLLFIVSFLVLRRNFRAGRIIALIAIFLNVCYYLLAVVLLVTGKTSTVEVVFGLIVGLLIVLWLIRYAVVLLRDRSL